MIDAARGVLGERATYAVANVEALPFADESFDVVLANHMLYDVGDRPTAIAELARVLVPGGVLHAATNGDDHMRELRELVGRDDWPFVGYVEAFGLESGRAQLEAVFPAVARVDYEDSLEVPEAGPLVDYVLSSSFFRGDAVELRRAVEARLARDGVFRVAKDSGVLTARKP
jgi:SAM-dependent methyltransferase